MSINNFSAGLLYSFAEMEREISNMAKIASTYMDDCTQEIVINPWLQKLKNFRKSPPGSTLGWEIPRGTPLRTRPSTGDYEPSGRGEHTIHAELSSIWDISIPSVVGATPRRGIPQKYFSVVGRASTRISLIAHSGGNETTELARWRFEIGDAAAPGCHFHTQIMGEDDDEVFPHTLSVPRLPNILFTPMDALEFVLAELFQKEWPQHVAKDGDAIKTWSGCQKSRLIKLLKWQQTCLEKYSGSPWTSLKVAKPDANLLVGAR